MAADAPLLLMLMIGAACLVAKWWTDDYRAFAAGRPVAKPMPGAVPAPRGAYVVAVVGTLALVGLETAGEYALGISEQQSRMTVLFGIHTLAAAFLEELIFRGYVVVTGRGRGALVGSIVLASAIFALLHPFLWEWDDGTLRFAPSRKAWFSTGAVFAGSLWFYALRFMGANPLRSLLPCVAAHVTKNAAVFAIKLAQGHVTGWW